jgi:chemotaxis family two-component system response regulator PixG
MAALVRPEQSVNSVTQIWKQWYTAGLGTIDPDQAPRIQYPDQLKQKVSANTYNTLQKVVDGQRTLREIGVLMKQKLQPLTSSLLPYLQQGLMTMNPVVDIAFPFFPEQAKASSNTPLVACIDDSPQICQIMKVILEREGYQFVAIRDSLRAVSILLNQKPALIFLDLVMPVANGYEVCAQIRRVSALKKTPVVILTGNDGVVDRIRANMVGATDFLSKPIDDKKVIKLLQQYCPI